MKAEELTFAISPAVNLSVRIVFHPSRRALRREWLKTDSTCDPAVKAFCLYHDEKDKVICSLHFQPEHRDALTIAHETLHLILHLARRLHLNTEENQAEEIMATATEHTMKQIFKFRRSVFSRRPSR